MLPFGTLYQIILKKNKQVSQFLQKYEATNVFEIHNNNTCFLSRIIQLYHHKNKLHVKIIKNIFLFK